MEIEVSWEVKPKSGTTFIDLSDLDCKDKREWNELAKEEQRSRINKYLIESDQSTLKPLATEW